MEIETPIKVNGRNYYFKNIFGGEYSSYYHTNFYIKGEPIKKRVVKKRYWLWGKVVSDEIVEVDNFILCFHTYEKIIDPILIDIKKIKLAEEKYYREFLVKFGKLEL